MAVPNRQPPAAAAGRAPSTLSLVLALAGVVVVAAGLHAAQSIVAPVFFALTLIVAARPVQRRLVRLGMHRLLAALLVLLGLYLVLAGLAVALGFSVAQLSTTLPRYASEFQGLYQTVSDWLASLGMQAADIDELFGSVDFNSVLGLLQQAASGLSAAGAQVALLLVVMFFLAIDSTDTASRRSLLARARPRLSVALAGFVVAVGRYWIVATVFGLIVAVVDVVALYAIGVPLALTWGVLAFVTNYIPNVGFVLGLVPPALIGLLDGGVGTMVWVVVVYSVINFSIQSIVQPKITGDVVGLSPTVTFVSLVFWALVVGPLGALLAVPLTLFFKAVLIDADPSARWVNAFLVTASAAEEKTAGSDDGDGSDAEPPRRADEDGAEGEPHRRADAAAPEPVGNPHGPVPGDSPTADQS
ncbi:AI-2E family transporter [Georgenia sp. AZ-5]|uniref:AI-2E family transporter n=1 Tax=Georgenia sp. AZ-5 TaxID=3367526 RepID=UPI0037542E28